MSLRECSTLASFRDVAGQKGYDWSQISCPLEGRGCTDPNNCPLYDFGYEAVRGIVERHETVHVPGLIIQQAQPVDGAGQFYSRLNKTISMGK